MIIIVFHEILKEIQKYFYIIIVTKPGLTYFTANIDSEITVA